MWYWYVIAALGGFIVGLLLHNPIVEGLRKERDAALKQVSLLEQKIRGQLDDRVKALEVKLDALEKRLAK